MDSRKDVVYTESGKREMEEALMHYRANLVRIIRREKFVPGDNTLEITASDVQRAVRGIRPYSSRPFASRELVLRIYTILGILMAVAGLFYDQLRSLLLDDPFKIVLFLAGAIFSVASFVLSQFYRARRLVEEREREIIERIQSHVE